MGETIEPFASLHGAVAAWCRNTLGEATAPQREGIPPILEGRHVLICSPTGTGKTLTAFLPIFSDLAERRDRDELFARTTALYVSPLRALGYDVEHNVRRPLREMALLERPDSERDRVRRGRIRSRFVRTGVRTGDTPIAERRLMLSRPPHILMTTPESLAIVLAMESYRATLRDVRYVVLDEVHALAGNKRGAYLSLLLESLEEIVRAPVQRIGLSATVAPLESVAEYLVGAERDCTIVDTRALRDISIEIRAPFTGAMAPLATIARAAHSAIERAGTTLVFTNVRSQTERIAYELRALDGDGSDGDGRDGGGVEAIEGDAAPRESDARIGVHHSALERSVRHRTEARLRAGELRAVVCSASLELGVVIGAIEQVLLVGGAR
ncbi:MAG: DEAD/DEAH box helicase, partial [Candidatus Eremiobacteraeota bacterium]|nr:DEAD/DEAH box helicase [Candidatus Eremiobacteraeota bacterium]